MKRYSVSLYIMTAAMGLRELSDLLGLDGGADSHEVGSPRPSRVGTPARVWDKTVWKHEASCSPSQDLVSQISYLLQAMPMERLQSPALPPDVDKILDIAVSYDTAYCSVEIGADCLSAIAACGLGIEITCYPTDFDC